MKIFHQKFTIITHYAHFSHSFVYLSYTCLIKIYLIINDIRVALYTYIFFNWNVITEFFLEIKWQNPYLLIIMIQKKNLTTKPVAVACLSETFCFYFYEQYSSLDFNVVQTKDTYVRYQAVQCS